MIRDGFIQTLQRRLTRARQAPNLAEAEYRAAVVHGMISAGFLLDALAFEERELLDELTINALTNREAELRAQGVFA